MEEVKINRNVTKKISDNGEVKFYKKIKYDMNWYYTKLSENIYKQMGLKCSETDFVQEEDNKYIVTNDIQKDKEMFLGNSITQNRKLSQIQEDIRKFLFDKNIDEDNINEVCTDFLKMTLADIQTANPDRHGGNWCILLKDNKAELGPNFDYDYTFSQNEYAMKGIAEAVENEDKSIISTLKKKYNINKFTGYLNETVNHIGLELGEGETFLVDSDTEKFDFKNTAKYIRNQLGEKEYLDLINKVNIDEALPVATNKDYEVYGLIGKLHSCNIREKIINKFMDYGDR